VHDFCQRPRQRDQRLPFQSRSAVHPHGWLLIFENTCDPGSLPPARIGLSNIQPTAGALQKPEGASEALKQEQAAELGQKSDGRKAERCVSKTDLVDCEIERLK
jgi:hypothetical protein